MLDVTAWMTRWQMFPPPGGLILCAVSGGRDSVCLLDCLWRLGQQRDFRVAAAHLNHGMRPTAQRDEELVRTLCDARNIPLHTERVEVYALAAAWHLTVEETGRRARYDFLRRTASAIRADFIATAHHREDQAETVLLQLLRGTGMQGLTGIPSVRDTVIRPLLDTPRAAIDAYIAENALPYVTDETNLDQSYARNRLRHNALPALESTNAAAVQNLARFCEKAARVDAYLAAGAAKLLAAARLPGAEPAWQLTPLQAADPLLLETALHSLVAPVRDAEEKYVQLLCAVVRQGSGAVQLTGQVRFCAGNGCLRQEMLPDALLRQLESAPQQVPLLPEKQPEFRLRGGWKGKAELLTADFEEKIQVVHKKDLKNRADYARITTLYTGLVLRARQPGDRFRPAGRGLSKPLRKWMNEAGVPNELRDTLPLLASGSEILWVCGEGFADGLAPDTESRWILHLDAEIETQEEKTNEYAR